ncbi:MAG TPA: hypothetical protein VLS93_02315 [Anaeromyxobacteraceae bacterium]|nr:hypothetical protein [Anaeromyxobacteraceae bacterium]
MTRIPWTFLAAALLAAPASARADPAPSSTDEARSLAGLSLPRDVAPAAALPGAVPTTTDAARALARAPAAAATAVPIAAISTTDQARGVAGGLLVLAPVARRAMVAHCGSSCDCARR